MQKTKPVSSKLDSLLRLVPGYDPFLNSEQYYFCEESAEAALAFFPQCLTHVKGSLGGKPFILEPWQQAIIANVFGWKRPDGTRRYREVFIYVPRKNGKTTLVAGIVLYMLFCDGEWGAEVYSAAADREQASLVYEQAKGMVLNEPELERRGKVFRTFKSITYEETGSTYKAISAEADTKHGYNAHCVVIDELHAQPDRELVDVLMTSTGSRDQPLVVHITTSDFFRESICNDKYNYARRVRDGDLEDHKFLPVIYEALPEDDWKSPEVWAKANPNYGVSVNEEYLAGECQRAQDEPSFENTFKRLHLNVQTEQDTRWLRKEWWEGDCAKAFNPLRLRGKPCYAGLDLSSTQDITALVLAFKEGPLVYLLPFFWVPAESARKKERKDKVPYTAWENQGLVEFTEGSAVDYDRVRMRINELREEYQIKEICVDKWNATQLVNDLQDKDHIKVAALPQGFGGMSDPSKQFERLFMRGLIRHNNNPVLRWMYSNVSKKEDGDGNIRPDRKKSTDKIDGIVASIMAIALMGLDRQKESVYKTRGFLQV